MPYLGLSKQDAGLKFSITKMGAPRLLPFPWALSSCPFLSSKFLGNRRGNTLLLLPLMWCLRGCHRKDTSHLPYATKENRIASEASLVRGLHAGKQNKINKKTCESPSILSVAQHSSCLCIMKETIVGDGLRHGNKHVVISPKRTVQSSFPLYFHISI